MTPNRNPNSTPEHYYNAAVAATKIVIVTGQTNLYGFEVENNSSSAEVFLQIFNKVTANVTVGTTAPDMTFRIPAGSNFGKDAADYALKYCDQGLVIAVTSGRSNATAPAAAATVNIWFSQGA